MKRSRIFKLLMLGALVGGLLVAVAAVSAGHSWNGYHWKGANLSPTVVDETSSTLYDVPAAVTEWAGLGTLIQPVSTNKRKGKVSVGEGFSLQWLGIARSS